MLDEIPEETFRATDRITDRMTDRVTERTKRSSSGMEVRQLWKGMAMIVVVFVILFLGNKLLNMVGAYLWPDSSINSNPEIAVVHAKEEQGNEDPFNKIISSNTTNTTNTTHTPNTSGPIASNTQINPTNHIKQSDNKNKDTKNQNNPHDFERALTSIEKKSSTSIRANQEVKQDGLKQESRDASVASGKDNKKLQEVSNYYQEKLTHLEIEVAEQKEKINQLIIMLNQQQKKIDKEKDSASSTISASTKNAQPVMSTSEATKNAQPVTSTSTSTPAPTKNAHLTTSASVKDLQLTSTEQKILNIDANHYAIQIFSADNKKRALNFLKQIKHNQKVYLYQTTRNAKPWYVLISGEYPDFATANKALIELPKDLLVHNPWVRRYRGIQESIRDKS